MRELEAIAKALNIDVADIFAESQIDQYNKNWKNLLEVINGMAQLRDSGTSSIGANIRRAREARKMSQNQLAKKIGISQTTVSEIETGDRDITTGKLWEITRELDVPIESLLPPPNHPVMGDVWAARKFALALWKQNLPS